MDMQELGAAPVWQLASDLGIHRRDACADGGWGLGVAFQLDLGGYGLKARSRRVGCFEDPSVSPLASHLPAGRGEVQGEPGTAPAWHPSCGCFDQA